jgi:signal transduction protein with GAF and PtsI domain
MSDPDQPTDTPPQPEDALIAQELAAMRRLHELVGRLLVCPDLRTALDEILAATVEISGAEMGNVQLFDAAGQALVIVAQRGFGPDFLDRFRVVGTDSDTSCARAFRQGWRIVIADVEADGGFEPYRKAAAEAGFRSVQSTPLVGRGGVTLGVLSTHYRRPRRPSERELRILDLYTRQAADVIERARTEERLRESEGRLRVALSWGCHLTAGSWTWTTSSRPSTRATGRGCGRSSSDASERTEAFAWSSGSSGRTAACAG